MDIKLIGIDVYIYFFILFINNVFDRIAVSPNGFLTTHPITYGSYANWWSEDGTNYYRRYIAPLMTDFNPSNDTNSHVYIHSTPNYFNVQWKNVPLYEPLINDPNAVQNPLYTFQVTLQKDTNIIYFIYFNIDANISDYHVYNHEIPFKEHIGVEDAMYEYDHTTETYMVTPYKPVTIDPIWAKTGTVIRLTPKPTCLDEISCGGCTDKNTITTECEWHSEINLCVNTNEVSRINGIDEDLPKITERIQCGNNPYESPSSRTCFFEQRVLIKNNGEDGYSSGVIQSLESQSIGIIKDEHYFDVNADGNIFVPYHDVYLCPQVSWNYNVNELPTECAISCDTAYDPSSCTDCAVIIEPSHGGHVARTILIFLFVALLVGVFSWFLFYIYKQKQSLQHQHMEEVPDNEAYNDDFSDFSRGNSLGIMGSPELQIHSDGSESLPASVKKPAINVELKIPETILQEPPTPIMPLEPIPNDIKIVEVEPADELKND